ncbi:MAG TPA: V-type ATP synthase subunit E [Lachnospiraceae bacterium]|nr:V-type ATP synthase subunit E [Lachnospiraceae bacterium]
MAGIDDITDEILKEAKERAEAFLTEAKKKAAAEEDAARKEAGALKKAAADQAEKDARDISMRAGSSAGLERRKAVLVAKQEIIDGIIKRAYEKLDTQDDASYFGMIEKLLRKSLRKENGEICFSAKDLKRMPAGFEEKIRTIAADGGGSLTLCKEAAAIDNGFILRYGGIEENCSLPAIFAERRDELQDKVHAVLW